MYDLDGIDSALLSKYAPNRGLRALLPKLRAEARFALTCRALAREGWDDHVAGHITWRQPDGSILVNPWELSWQEIRAADVVRVDRDGRTGTDGWNVTPALSLHLQLHRMRPDVTVVLHNHPRWSGIWACLREVPGIYDQTSAYCGADLPIFDEYSGTFDSSARTLAACEALGSSKWALLANHGALIVGRDLRQAHFRAVTLEWRSRRAYEVRLAGGGHALADSVISDLSKVDASGFPFLWEAMMRRELSLDKTVIE